MRLARRIARDLQIAFLGIFETPWAPHSLANGAPFPAFFEYNTVTLKPLVQPVAAV
jgi:hypothetical protein